MAKSRTPPSESPLMDSLFASLEAGAGLDRAPDGGPQPKSQPEPQAKPQPEPQPGPSAEGREVQDPPVEALPRAQGTLDEVDAAKRGAQTRQRTAASTRLGRRKKPAGASPAASSDSTSKVAGPSPSPASPAGALTISALSSHIVALFERDALMRDVWVVGEVSNWKRYGSGHAYFSLKDGGASISAVMWRGAVAGHAWLPTDGDQVLAHGYVGVYPERGNYQLYVNQIRPAGRGQLYAAFEALKERLSAEGLFAAERKRPLPATIRRAGIITSRDGAALRDILRIVAQRWPLLDLLLFPTAVQGADCPAQVVAALANANRYSLSVEPLDVLILARGGGSIEDLWGFNSEEVARAIVAGALPVVTGVGHETDFTIADFVADLRAPTPSAAALAICPDRADLLTQLEGVGARLAGAAASLLDYQGDVLEQRRLRLARHHPQRRLVVERQRLDDRSRRLSFAMQRSLSRRSDRVVAAAQRLDALSPLAVLQRGYSIVLRRSGEVVLGPEMAEPGEELTVRAARGRYAVLRKPAEPEQADAPAASSM